MVFIFTAQNYTNCLAHQVQNTHCPLYSPPYTWILKLFILLKFLSLLKLLNFLKFFNLPEPTL